MDFLCLFRNIMALEIPPTQKTKVFFYYKSFVEISIEAIMNIRMIERFLLIQW